MHKNVMANGTPFGECFVLAAILPQRAFLWPVVHLVRYSENKKQNKPQNTHLLVPSLSFLLLVSWQHSSIFFSFFYIICLQTQDRIFSNGGSRLHCISMYLFSTLLYCASTKELRVVGTIPPFLLCSPCPTEVVKPIRASLKPM